MATAMSVPRDPNTLSNYNNFVTTKTKIDIDINFNSRSLTSRVLLALKSVTNAEATEILLDSSFLHIKDVTFEGKPAEWRLLPRFEPYGSALKIILGEGVANGQTCQIYDTPDVKSTYEFIIKSSLPVIASGHSTGTQDLNDGTKLYFYSQDIPIPSYLFALASGDIEQAKIGPRSVVATNPENLRAAKWELEESTEGFIKTVEKIVFPYAWETYNVLILPSSFPYGGMENPIYTYATPTIISGDRENVDVIAHELSHSYSGNLVSNASWEHFWLNEGWTTYLERRIQAAVHGEAFRDFSAIIGWKALQDSVKQFGETHEFTKLIIDLKGKDPDDAFSSIPYEKGYTFLSYLESVVGKQKWNTFIPHYFTKFARSSLDSYDFKSCLLAFFKTDPAASAALGKVDFDFWFYSPGLPPKPDFDTSLVDICYKLAVRWKDYDANEFQPDSNDIRGWSANQIVVFLDEVLGFAPALSAKQSQTMASAYNFAMSGNVEVKARYFQIGLKAKDESVYKSSAQLLGEVGRMKFVRPLFKELNVADRQLAVKTFEKNKKFYHPICRGLVEKDLFGQGSEQSQ
ncbi:Leucyl aminopeptidase yscIV [Lecanora helva]